MNKNKWRGIWKKIALIVVITMICTLTYAWNIIINEWYGEIKEQLYCFELSGNKLPALDEKEPKLGFGIYFHETSCPKDTSDITLTARQSCSIESALKAHPNTDVFLLISSPVLKPLQETENIFIQELLNYRNFKVRHITFSKEKVGPWCTQTLFLNFPAVIKLKRMVIKRHQFFLGLKYLSQTPLNAIYKSGALNSSLWPVQHSSDVLRYATLYKFGGIYLDLDVIVLKSLTSLKNFAGAESNMFLGSGILGFSSDKTGREVATQCAKELASTYNAKVWGFNGPGVITRVMEKRCKTNVIPKMMKSFCGGFQVYPTEYFQAISFSESHLFFQEGNFEKVKTLLNRSYTIHYWNKISSNYVLDNRLDIPYLYYARKYCPRIFDVAKGNFN